MDIVIIKLTGLRKPTGFFRHIPEEFEPDYDCFLNFVHADDREYVNNAVKQALNGKPFNIDFRISLADA